MTKMTDIKKMKESEFAQFIKEKREVVRQAGFGMNVKNTNTAREARKDIARALTELKTRQANPVTE